MIRSGLVSQHLGGGFEKGYPHERNNHPRNRLERPVVFKDDRTILTPSAYSDPMKAQAITPSPVFYNDLFGKKVTPDERLYILRQAQGGKDKIQKAFISKPNLEAKPVKAIEGAPIQPEVDGIDGQEMLEEEEMAVDVVDPPPRQESIAEQSRATNEWINEGSIRGAFRDAAAGTLGFIAGDVSGAFAAIEGARYVDQYWNGGAVAETIRSNGDGPRHREIAPAA